MARLTRRSTGSLTLAVVKAIYLALAYRGIAQGRPAMGRYDQPINEATRLDKGG